MSSRKQYDDGWKVSRARGSFTHFTTGSYQVLAGHVAAPEGIVAAQVWRPEDGDAEVHLSVVHEGREHRRVLHRDINERGLTIIAARFLREVTHA